MELSGLAQAETPRDVKATAALVAGLELLESLDTRIGKLRERLAELEAQREETRARVAARVPFGWWRIGDYLLRRTLVEPRPSVDAWRAIEEGAVQEETLRPYMTARRPFERWTLKRRRATRVSA
jgi:hypothetical protein